MKPRFDDPAARQALRDRLAGLGERSARKSYYPQLQRRLAELERFRALLDETTEGIYLLALPAGQLIDVSGSACRQLGRPRAELLGGRLRDWAEPPGDERLAELLEGGPGPEVRASLAATLRRADGGRFPAELSVRRVSLEGSPFAVVVARDTTERDRLQARLVAADRLVSMGTLAAGVAHEVNNPLTYVVGNLEFAQRKIEELRVATPAAGPARAALLGPLDELGAALDDAADGADRVRRIVRDLKAFSRVDDEGRAPQDVRAVLDVVLAMASGEIRHRARLVRDFGEVPPVVANEGRLSQVFLNLVINAAQAIEEGSAERNEITIRTFGEDGQAVVEVRDTGAGIPAEHLPHLFDPFFTTKPAGVGTGLGLAICHGIVAQLGGSIEVETRPGAGSRFRVRLPGAAGPAPRPGVQAPPPALRAGRILVVDDEPLAGLALRRLLAPPHEVEVCVRARDALDRLRAGLEVDVILCDLLMPELSGMELHAVLRRERPELARRVVFVTGGGFTPRARAFLLETRAPWIEKPVSIAALRAAIDAVAAAGP